MKIGDKLYGAIILDDNELIGRVIEKALEPYDTDIYKYTDPVEFFRDFNTLQADVVFIDHGLPNRKGADVIKQIKDTFPLPPRIIAISGWGPATGERMIECGADAFLAKPFGVRQLEAALSGCLGPRRKKQYKQKKQP